MLHDIAFVFWYFLPAAFANSIPIAAVKLPGIKNWNSPMDFGRTYKGKPILGPHKTWRGVATGIVVATITLWLEQLLVRHTGWAHRLTIGYDYAHYPTLLLGPLFAIGALGGDALKSFFKRRRGTESGKTWFPFDQTDYIVGGALLTAPFIHLSFVQYIWLVVIWFGMHLVASWFGWAVGLKDQPI